MARSSHPISINLVQIQILLSHMCFGRRDVLLDCARPDALRWFLLGLLVSACLALRHGFSGYYCRCRTEHLSQRQR